MKLRWIIVWLLVIAAWLVWIFSTGCSSSDDGPTTPDAASGLPWCRDLGCAPEESDRMCGLTGVCYCMQQRCERTPVSPTQ